MEHRCVSQRGFQKRAFHFRQDPRRRITSKLLALYVVMILLFIGSAVLY